MLGIARVKAGSARDSWQKLLSDPGNARLV